MGGAGLVPPWGLAGLTEYPAWWGSVGPASFPWDGAFSPWVFFFMCFEDHFCIVRSEEKKYSDMVEKRYLHTLVGRKGKVN